MHQVHTSLSLQEEAAHRTEREKRGLEEAMARLRTSLHAAQAESRALQVQSKDVLREMLKASSLRLRKSCSHSSAGQDADC